MTAWADLQVSSVISTKLPTHLTSKHVITWMSDREEETVWTKCPRWDNEGHNSELLVFIRYDRCHRDRKSSLGGPTVTIRWRLWPMTFVPRRPANGERRGLGWACPLATSPRELCLFCDLFYASCHKLFKSLHPSSFQMCLMAPVDHKQHKLSWRHGPLMIPSRFTFKWKHADGC